MKRTTKAGEQKRDGPKGSVRRYTYATFFCAALALASILALGRWGALRDFEQTRESLLRATVAEAASHAQRTIRRIEIDVLQGKLRPDFEKFDEGEWLLSHWRNAILREEKWSHAAVEDLRGRIVAHSNPALEGSQLLKNWYDRVVPLAGAHVVETHFVGLTEGRRTFDVCLPIKLRDATIGTYHAGISGDWFDASLRAQQEYVQAGWRIVIGGTALLVLAALGSLYLVGRQTAALQRRLELADARRVSELTQLVVGLAHEVRNPLNAVRLNLHAIARVYRGEARLPADEIATILRESSREISRVAALIAEMMGYARSDPPRVEEVDLGAEVRGTLNLVKQTMEDQHVAVVARLAQEPLSVRIDRDRLRQVLLNLLNNAREAVGRGGRIEVEVSRKADGLELTVGDNGPGIPRELRPRIFEPFFSTKDVGIGLGLTLVHKFVTESGGTIVYDGADNEGGRFVVRLPAATPVNGPVNAEVCA